MLKIIESNWSGVLLPPQSELQSAAGFLNKCINYCNYTVDENHSKSLIAKKNQLKLNNRILMPPTFIIENIFNETILMIFKHCV